MRGEDYINIVIEQVQNGFIIRAVKRGRDQAVTSNTSPLVAGGIEELVVTVQQILEEPEKFFGDGPYRED